MSQDVLIIAEAGVNHNGDMQNALKLIDAAADAGADIVKFQTFKAEALSTKAAEMAAYQKENIGKVDSQFNMLKKLELKHEDHGMLIQHCQKRNIRFFSTGFDIESLKFLSTLNMGLWKVPSGEMTNRPYLEFLAQQKGDFILSSGMCDMNDIKAAIEIFIKAGVEKSRISILHCNTDYPTRMEDVHLNAMSTIHNETGLKVGYSDHTLGIEIPVAAVTLGAQIIEKHFTLDRTLPGPDHKASLEPQELKQMVIGIRNVSKALGRFEKKPTEREILNRAIARKSIVAAKAIKKGEILSEDNLTTKRPGTGLSPMKWHEIIGQKASKDYNADDLI